MYTKRLACRSGFTYMLQPIMTVTLKVGNRCAKACHHISIQCNINIKRTFLEPILRYIDGLLYLKKITSMEFTTETISIKKAKRHIMIYQKKFAKKCHRHVHYPSEPPHIHSYLYHLLSYVSFYTTIFGNGAVQAWEYGWRNKSE